MDELAKKISSYHIFNYLIPGVIFAYLVDNFIQLDIKFIQENMFVGVFLYYFIGSIISRIGSVVVSPIIDFLFKIEKDTYQNYVLAEAISPKLEILSEINNMYRAFYSTFFIISLISIFNSILLKKFNISLIFFLAGFILYVFSYKKQTMFITKRIKKIINSTPD